MRLPGQKLLLAAGATGAVLVVGIVAAVTDHLDLAVVCVLLVQSAALLAVIDTRRRHAGLSDLATTQAASFARVDREVANVSLRVVTEAQASGSATRTELDALREEIAALRRAVESG
jgi:hypothetical protein